MKKLFCLSFLALGMVVNTMSAMNSPVPSQNTINITTAAPQDAAWPEPGNPRPPYDK
jgi:hypothetical protein